MLINYLLYEICVLIEKLKRAQEIKLKTIPNIIRIRVNKKVY